MVMLEVSDDFGVHLCSGLSLHQILSELEPYHHLPTEHAVFKHILHGGRPIRTHLDPHVVTRRIWNFLTSLWHENAALRPAMPDVLAMLTDIDMYVDF